MTPIELIDALLLASTAGVAWFTIRATRRKTVAEAHLADSSAAEAVSQAALKLVEPLNKRIEVLEKEIKRLTNEISEMRKLEEYLQAEIHARDTQIKTLTAVRTSNATKIAQLTGALERARVRIRHLEELCKRAGLNGDEVEGGGENELV